MVDRNAQGAGRAGENANKIGAENRGNKQRNLQGNQVKARSGKPTGYEGAAQAPRAMTQKSRAPQMGARNPQMGGKHPQMGAKRAQPSGQQQPKKKQGKPEEQRGRR
jgi:hypothetical protein